MWLKWDSNQRPLGYKSSALLSEIIPKLLRNIVYLNQFDYFLGKVNVHRLLFSLQATSPMSNPWRTFEYRMIYNVCTHLATGGQIMLFVRNEWNLQTIRWYKFISVRFISRTYTAKMEFINNPIRLIFVSIKGTSRFYQAK